MPISEVTITKVSIPMSQSQRVSGVPYVTVGQLRQLLRDLESADMADERIFVSVDHMSVYAERSKASPGSWSTKPITDEPQAASAY